MKRVMQVLLASLTVVTLLNPAIWTGCQPVGNRMQESGPLVVDADELQHTVVTPHLEAAIAADTNVLYCGSFQLAWNELCKLTGGPVQFVRQPTMADVLNERSLTSADVDPGCYVAEAGYVRDGIYSKISQAMQKTFHGHNDARMLPHPSITGRPQDIVVYSYLQRDLTFAHPFEDADVPLLFGKTQAKTACFGMTPGKEGHEAMVGQISIVDYKSPDDFIIELVTQTESNRLILAKIAANRTLAKTVDDVEKRLAAAHPALALPQDILAVPKMNFDITTRYDELLGRRLKPTSARMAGDLTCLAADQNTRFRLDEKGVKLRSESHMEFGCAASSSLPPPHVMVFDQPFLVMIQRRDRKTPFFALWVGNADLLVRAK